MVSTIGFDQTRTYASKPIARSAGASRPVAATAKTYNPHSAASAVESGWKGGLHANLGRSFKQGNDLEKRIHDLSGEIQSLNVAMKASIAKVAVQETQITSLKSRAEGVEAELLRAKSKAQRDLQDQKARHRQELERLGPLIAENKSYVAEVQSQAKLPLLHKINLLDQNKLELKREVQALKAEIVEQQKRHEIASRSATAHSRDISIAFDKAKKELRDMKKRKLEDREDYTRYQNVFADLNDKIHLTREEIYYARRRVDEEGAYWQKSTRDFKTSANLRLFLHSSKYQGTKSAIQEFLEARAAHAKTTSDGLKRLELGIMQARTDMQYDAHNSRNLTRHHQFDGHQSAYNSAHLAHLLATTTPFQHLRKKYQAEIENLEKIIEEKSRIPDSDNVRRRLETQVQVFKDQRRKVQRFLAFFGYLQEWRALEALRDDDIVEKAVWVDTVEARQALNTFVDRFHDANDLPIQDAEEWTQRQHHRDDVRLKRREFENLVAQVRQRHLLAHDLGKMQPEEKSRVDVTINRLTELAKRAVDGSLAGLGFQKPLPRRPKPIQKPNEDSAATVASSEKATTAVAAATAPKNVARSLPPAAGLDAVKARLQARFADVLHARFAEKKKKRRSQPSTSAEKKPVTSKPTPRGKIRPKKTPAVKRKKATVSSSPKVSKSEPGTIMSGESNVEGSVSGIGFSGLKPTKPWQAQYRMPSYDTDAGAEKRGFRGDNMGFTTLKDALEGASGGPMFSSASPTQVDSPEKPPSEDGTSAYQSDSSDGPSEAGQSSSDAVNAVPEEPQTILSYNIPPKDYRDAAMASPNSNAAYWSHTLYKNAENQRPVVYYCQSYEATEARAKLFLNEPVIGFDLEWEFASTMKGDSPDIKRNVSLIQIACEDKIGLFQLARFRTAKTAEEHMPPSLRKILESADIVKAGVNVNGDASRIKKCLGVEMRGVFELSHMFRLVKQSEKVRVNFTQVRLADQVQDVLLLPLKKDSVRVSAWSRELNTQQTSYAAADAYAGFMLFHKLDNARKLMVPRPPRPAFFETMQPIVLGDGTEVFRSTHPSEKKRTVVKKGEVEEVVENEEEEEEFIDALEELDTYELGEKGPANPEVPESAVATQEISYPSLPVQESRPRSITGTTSTTPVPSRSTTLPFRAKLTAKPSAPPQSSKSPPPEEESLIANRSAPQARSGPLPCPENQAAETWIMTYRAKHAKTTVGTPILRAYHLWHHQHFELKEVAGFCRGDPPLAMTTVASYIMQALKEADLPFDSARVKSVLGILPGSVHGRYRVVLEKGRE